MKPWPKSRTIWLNAGVGAIATILGSVTMLSPLFSMETMAIVSFVSTIVVTILNLYLKMDDYAKYRKANPPSGRDDVTDGGAY